MTENSIPQNEYLDVVRKLPLPTDEQSGNFACHVMEAHSWYKHLPLHPGLPFCFYLDPNAGRYMVLNRDGDITFSDIPPGGRQPHYNIHPTEDYRKLFGFWTYHGPYGRWILAPTKDGIIDTRGHLTRCMLDATNRSSYTAQFYAGLDKAMAQKQSRQDTPQTDPTGIIIKAEYDNTSIEDDPPIIKTDAGKWMEIPMDLLRQGSLLLTALMHPARNMHLYWVYDEKKEEVLKFPDFLGRDFRFIPQDLMQAMTTFYSLQQTAGYREEFESCHHRAESEDSRAGNKMISWEHTESFRKEQEILNTMIYPKMNAVRAAQYSAMKKCMTRFLTTITNR